eukprot:3869443-Rhodomonas_salina.1
MALTSAGVDRGRTVRRKRSPGPSRVVQRPACRICSRCWRASCRGPIPDKTQTRRTTSAATKPCSTSCESHVTSSNHARAIIAFDLPLVPVCTTRLRLSHLSLGAEQAAWRAQHKAAQPDHASVPALGTGAKPEPCVWDCCRRAPGLPYKPCAKRDRALRR